MTSRLISSNSSGSHAHVDVKIARDANSLGRHSGTLAQSSVCAQASSVVASRPWRLYSLFVGLWKWLSRKPARPPENAASAGDDPPQPDPYETYSRKLEQIPERFTSVPEGYVVEHLSWEEY